jgi:hypothetical protein
MSRWYPEVITHWDATKAARMGRYGALGMAAWLGIPAIISVSIGSVQRGFVSGIEILVVAVLVGLSLCGAHRFAVGQGARIGAILLVILVVEVSKRVMMTVGGDVRFGVFDAVVTFMMFFGLLNGIRGARALRYLTPEDDLKDVFS